MISTTRHTVRAGMRWAGITVLTSGLFGAGLAHLSSQESLPGAPVARTVAPAVVDSYQRTYEVLGNNELASSGAARGQTLYFYKCWMCHNNGGRNGDKSGLVGPSLTEVTTRLKTDEALAGKISTGGARMPAFRHTLT